MSLQNFLPPNRENIGYKVFPVLGKSIRLDDPDYIHYTPAEPVFGDRFETTPDRRDSSSSYNAPIVDDRTILRTHTSVSSFRKSYSGSLPLSSPPQKSTPSSNKDSPEAADKEFGQPLQAPPTPPVFSEDATVRRGSAEQVIRRESIPRSTVEASSMPTAGVIRPEVSNLNEQFHTFNSSIDEFAPPDSTIDQCEVQKENTTVEGIEIAAPVDVFGIVEVADENSKIDCAVEMNGTLEAIALVKDEPGIVDSPSSIALAGTVGATTPSVEEEDHVYATIPPREQRSPNHHHHDDHHPERDESNTAVYESEYHVIIAPLSSTEPIPIAAIASTVREENESTTHTSTLTSTSTISEDENQKGNGDQKKNSVSSSSICFDDLQQELKHVTSSRGMAIQQKEEAITKKEQEVETERQKVKSVYTAEKFLDEVPKANHDGSELDETERRSLAQQLADKRRAEREAELMAEFEEWKRVRDLEAPCAIRRNSNSPSNGK